MFLRVCIWYFDNWSNCPFVRVNTSSPYIKRGRTNDLYIMYEVLGFKPFDPWSPVFIREYAVRLATVKRSLTLRADSFFPACVTPRCRQLSESSTVFSPSFQTQCLSGFNLERRETQIFVGCILYLFFLANLTAP